MAIQHHPLSNAALGLFLVAETQTTKSGNAPASFKTMFLYQKGYVILDNNWKYREHLYKSGIENNCFETEGTNDNPSSSADTHAIFEQILDTTISNLPREQSSVSPALDKQSIDGMDDMSEHFHIGMQSDKDYRSAADEASTELKITKWPDIID